MTHDTLEEIKEITKAEQTPPLCLTYYFAERAEPPECKPPPPRARAYITERRGNLIILEFTDPPKESGLNNRGFLRKSLLARFYNGLFLLLFLACLYGCIAAFRF